MCPGHLVDHEELPSDNPYNDLDVADRGNNNIILDSFPVLTNNHMLIPENDDTLQENEEIIWMLGWKTQSVSSSNMMDLITQDPLTDGHSMQEYGIDNTMCNEKTTDDTNSMTVPV